LLCDLKVCSLSRFVNVQNVQYKFEKDTKDIYNTKHFKII